MTKTFDHISITVPLVSRLFAFWNGILKKSSRSSYKMRKTNELKRHWKCIFCTYHSTIQPFRLLHCISFAIWKILITFLLKSLVFLFSIVRLIVLRFTFDKLENFSFERYVVVGACLNAWFHWYLHYIQYKPMPNLIYEDCNAFGRLIYLLQIVYFIQSNPIGNFTIVPPPPNCFLFLLLVWGKNRKSVLFLLKSTLKFLKLRQI